VAATNAHRQQLHSLGREQIILKAERDAARKAATAAEKLAHSREVALAVARNDAEALRESSRVLTARLAAAEGLIGCQTAEIATARATAVAADLEVELLKRRRDLAAAAHTAEVVDLRTRAAAEVVDLRARAAAADAKHDLLSVTHMALLNKQLDRMTNVVTRDVTREPTARASGILPTAGSAATAPLSSVGAGSPRDSGGRRRSVDY
jgi:hypothetical protein